MKQQRFFKAITLLLAFVLIISFFGGCTKTSSGVTGESDKPEVNGDTNANTSESVPKAITFPLKEKFTFSMMLKGNQDTDAFMVKNKFYQKVIKESNVEVEFINLGDQPLVTLNAMFASGTEGDSIPVGVLNDSNISEFAANGLLMPIEDFILNENIMPNYINRGLKNIPEALGAMTAPDGHIYSLARIGGDKAMFLESPMIVNQKWLDQLGIKAPTTLDEFYDMLVAFRDNDMNGNGNPNDEIPLLVVGSGSIDPYCTIQALLGIWGIPTKDSALDSYVAIKDGVVRLAPTTDEYKAAISTLSKWFKEGLIWSECYTANKDTFVAKRKNDVQLFGVILTSTPDVSTDYFENLIVIPYPDAPGYKKAAYVNPGINGYKNSFTLTRNVKNPEIILSWLDQFFFSEEGTWYSLNGLPEEGRYAIENGQYVKLKLDSETSKKLSEESPLLGAAGGWGSWAWLTTPDEYLEGGRMYDKSNKTQVFRKNAFEIYADFLNKEIWPRPYYSGKDADRISELQTDIFNIISIHESQWVTGQSDINTDWDKYMAELKAAKVDELVSIYQRAYDNYLAGTKK